MSGISEVEIQRTAIDLSYRGQTLRDIELDSKFQAAPLADRLRGQKLQCALRRGKRLGLEFERDFLAFFFGAAGEFSFKNSSSKRAFFLFSDPLYFSDPSKLSEISFTSNWSLLDIGPDLWSVRPSWRPEEKYLYSKRAIKTTLLDQKVLAGIGNYLADETLWRLQISPFRPTEDVSYKEWEAIIEKAGLLSRSSFKRGGVSFQDNLNLLGERGRGADLFEVYERSGEPCFYCGGSLRKDKLAGRATYWCSLCQI